MNTKLFFQALIKFLVLVLIMVLLLFVPANSFNYWNGWLFMALMLIPTSIMGIVMMIKNPELLKKRLDLKEKEYMRNRKKAVIGSTLMIGIGFIASGLNYRYKWFVMPVPVVISSAILFIIAYAFYAEVLRENIYLSRTIEIQEGQKVVDTGLYAFVRHPMYASTIFLFLTLPFILGSIVSFFVFLFYPFFIAKRIEREEEFLEDHLEGYSEYKKKVRYKVIPFVW